MTGFLMFIHALVCIILVTVILMQSGRGSGLAEGFSAAESMFGAHTSSFMVKTTTIFATIFLVLCATLAVISSQRGKSLMPQKVSAPKSVEDLFPTQTEQPVIPKGDVTEKVLDKATTPAPLEKKL